MVKKFISSQLESLDTPLPDTPGIFRRNKINVIIINEDLSANTYFRKKPNSYLFIIGKRRYILIAKCFIKSKYPTIYYYYNNPLPILFQYKISQLTALDMRTEDQLKKLSEDDLTSLSHIAVDSETLNLAFDSRVMKGLYSEGGMTTKSILIILIVVVIIILIFLQIFGVVDIFGAISGAAGGKK